MSAAPVVDAAALGAAVVILRHVRDNDPWSGPSGTARPAQLPPAGDWRTWLILAGRGFGKTRTGAEYIRQRVQAGHARHVILAGPTAADLRDIMIEGESGLMAVCERARVSVRYEPSKRRVTFANGARCVLVSADEPDRFRGLQSDTVWADELAAWRYPQAWDQIRFGNRLGTDPRRIVTTTPRPIALLKSMMVTPETVVTRGSTYDNADNLADGFLHDVRTAYEGTTLGRQELFGELIEDVEGALWTLAMIDAARVTTAELPELKRVVVAIDPATTYGPDADLTGIAVVGLGVDGEWYVLAAGGYRDSPEAWARRALALYDQLDADVIVAESNQGGEMVRATLRNAAAGRMIAPKIELIHASRGKRVRAEPVALLYEQGRVHHVGMFRDLEDQMAGFPVSDDNDDIVDALVHGVTGAGLRTRAKARGV